jgi:hypothetical protein
VVVVVVVVVAVVVVVVVGVVVIVVVVVMVVVVVVVVMVVVVVVVVDLYEMEPNFLPCLPPESLTKMNLIFYPVLPHLKKNIFVLCSKFLDQVFGVSINYE